MSSIYAGGDHATAITNIKAAINARIVVLPDGTKDLDRESLIKWVHDQLQQMIVDAEATSASFIGGLDPTGAVMTLSNVVRIEHWQNRPDWPLNTGSTVNTQTASVAAVRDQQAVLKRLSEDVTSFYKDSDQKIFQTINDYLVGNIFPGISQGVLRTTEDRAYRYTYVSDRDEESAPSPVSLLITLDQNDTVGITVAAPPTGRNVSHFRVYRSFTGNSSDAFDEVPCAADADGWPIGTLAITDNVDAAKLLDPLATQLWDEPPADLQGLVNGSNGGMAGFRGNDFCPCVPYVPYAFPVALRRTVPWPIVGLAFAADMYFVGTRGRPVIFAGADTQSLTRIDLEEEQACVSRKSIVPMAGGFVYASPEGLCMATAGGVRLLTGQLFDREKWQALVPSSIIARESEGCYVFKWDNGTTNGTYSLDFRDGGKLVTISNTGSAFFRDPVSDRLYIATGTAIKELFSGGSRRAAVWRTKIVERDDYPSFAWLHVISDFEGGATVTVKLYGDGTLIQTAAITSREPVRVVAGRYREWEMQVEAAVKITKLLLAETTDEVQTL